MVLRRSELEAIFAQVLVGIGFGLTREAALKAEVTNTAGRTVLLRDVVADFVAIRAGTQNLGPMQCGRFVRFLVDQGLLLPGKLPALPRIDLRDEEAVREERRALSGLHLVKRSHGD